MTGKDIQNKIQQAGIKPQSVAEAMGILPQSLYSLFNSKSVKVDNLIEIAKAIDRPISWFFSEEDTFDISSPTSESNGVTIPSSVWNVIQLQAESLARKDEQVSDVINMLKSQLEKGDAASDATSAGVG